jgi:hypothetical protein
VVSSKAPFRHTDTEVTGPITSVNPALAHPPAAHGGSDSASSEGPHLLRRKCRQRPRTRLAQVAGGAQPHLWRRRRRLNSGQQAPNAITNTSENTHDLACSGTTCQSLHSIHVRTQHNIGIVRHPHTFTRQSSNRHPPKNSRKSTKLPVPATIPHHRSTHHLLQQKRHSAWPRSSEFGQRQGAEDGEDVLERIDLELS